MKITADQCFGILVICTAPLFALCFIGLLGA